MKLHKAKWRCQVVKMFLSCNLMHQEETPVKWIFTTSQHKCSLINGLLLSYKDDYKIINHL